MEQNKQMYLSPEVETFELKIGGVICQSGGAGVQNYGWNEYKEE